MDFWTIKPLFWVAKTVFSHHKNGVFGAQKRCFARQTDVIWTAIRLYLTSKQTLFATKSDFTCKQENCHPCNNLIINSFQKHFKNTKNRAHLRPRSQLNGKKRFWRSTLSNKFKENHSIVNNWQLQHIDHSRMERLRPLDNSHNVGRPAPHPS